MRNCKLAAGINSAMHSTEAMAKQASNHISPVVLGSKRKCWMCGRPKAACSTENDCTTHGLQMHLKSCHLGQRTRHLLATSGSIPVKSNKSFMLSTKTANCSIVHRERSDIRKQLLSIITGRLSLKAAVIPGARDASMSLCLSPAVACA